MPSLAVSVAPASAILPPVTGADPAPVTGAVPRSGTAAKANPTGRVAGSPTRPMDPTRSIPSSATTAALPYAGATAQVLPTTAKVEATPADASAVVVPSGDSASDTAPLLSATNNAVGASTSLPANVSPTAAAPTPAGYTPATPDAMAASIIALYRSGQPSLVLRLDPPGLGSVSVHVALGGNANVNVLFVPTVAQTAHLLQTGLGDLRQAMAASGLTLGQAQIGDGASGGTGGGNSGGNAAPRHGNTSPAVTATVPAETALPDNGIRGARAIA
jgi:flagellar hook-length control protein FliK